MTRIVAVRHGETDWNRNGRMQGWAPVPLNETGHEQAAAAATWLSDTYDIDRVIASDLHRTEQTAERILTATELADIRFEPEWRERDLGVYQGLTYQDIESRFPEFGLGETAYEATLALPEGGESLRDMADRVTGQFETVRDRYAGETVLVVTHGGPLHVLLGYARDLSLPAALKNHHLDNCAVTEFRVDSEEVEVVRENDTRWR